VAKWVLRFCAFPFLLQEIVEYAKTYTGRHVLIRVVMSTGDQSWRLELLGKLKKLRSNTALAFAVKTHAAVLEVQTELVNVHTKVTTVAHGIALLMGDRASALEGSNRVERLIQKLGGLEAIMADRGKRNDLVKLLGIENKTVHAAVRKSPGYPNHF
jgi:hypothetical protein